jgi:phosphoribosylanthranilate isomerase
MTGVKICGLTRAEDVLSAARLNAWAFGFVLTESPRRISAEHAFELTRRLPSADLTIAVFTTEQPQKIAEDARRAGVRGVQLSAGADGPSVSAVRAALDRAGLDVTVIAACDASGAVGADYVLVDAREPGRYGGTGRTVDWASLPRIEHERVILAGGIAPDNVGQAIRLARPFAIDVGSGLERAPGVKDRGRMAALFEAVRLADSREEGRSDDCGSPLR